MELLLLPGLDGSGDLFGPFIEALPAGFSARPVRYRAEDSEYERILETLELPPGEFGIVAESFSGPLGVMLASRCQRVRGLALAASFVTNPSRLTAAAALLRSMPRGSLPSWAMRRFLLGDSASEAECELVRQSISSTLPKTIAARLAQVRRVDARAELRALKIPKLLLRPEKDRLIARRAFDEVEASGARVLEVPGAPHLVLQRAAEVCAQACAIHFA